MHGTRWDLHRQIQYEYISGIIIILVQGTVFIAAIRYEYSYSYASQVAPFCTVRVLVRDYE